MMDELETPASADSRPRMSSGRAMYRTHSERYPIDLFSYTREARFCLDGRRFLAAIAMASTAVELIVNRDRRLKSLPTLNRHNGWANRNNGNLRIARDCGLPVEKLLAPGDDLQSNVPVRFVRVRNKVAHGEIDGLVRTLSDYDEGAQALASEQESKMRAFVTEWYNTAPDVQEGYIRIHQWPSD